MANQIINPPNIFKDTFGDRAQNMKPYQPVIIDMVTLERLFLQGLPAEISVEPDSKWINLETIGRNNPFYHFTGSEDTIKFNLSWYSNMESRDDVLKKVKWLEALTKNDGYNSAPHPVKFVFGNLFKASTFIVYRAPYRIGNFNREYGMLPGLAFQEIELRRVTETNSQRAQILNLNT